MKKIIAVLVVAFLLLQSLNASSVFPERNVSIGLKDNNLMAGQTLSVVLNPGSKLLTPVFLHIAIVDQSFSVVHQQQILFNKATEYRWNLPEDLKRGLYIAAVSVQNDTAIETVGLPFSYLKKDTHIPKSTVLLPVQEDTLFYGFSLFFKTNMPAGKALYYTLQAKDSVYNKGFVQTDSAGIIEVGGNEFYNNCELVFSFLDTCRGCYIEPYSNITNGANINYFLSVFNGADSTNLQWATNAHQAHPNEPLPGVIVRSKVKTRKELYEAKYVTNFMFKSPMSKEVVVDDDPSAINYNNNLKMYLMKVFPGLRMVDNNLLYRFGRVAFLVDEFPFRPLPDYMSEIAYIKFLPEPPRGLNEGPGFFAGGNVPAGITATVVVYTKKYHEDNFVPKKTLSLNVQGALDASR